MRLNRVVLPAPLGPIRPVMRSSDRAKDTRSTARTPPNSLLSPLTRSIVEPSSAPPATLGKAGRREQVPSNLIARPPGLRFHRGTWLFRGPMAEDEFTLYDLRVDVVAGERPMVCNHKVGDHFLLSGENLSFPPGQSFPLYSLAAILPLLPAKQRETHPNDWMTTDAEIACPDPHCGARFRITRVGKRTFRHSETTRVPLPSRP